MDAHSVDIGGKYETAPTRMREEVVTWKLYLGLAFTIPTLEHVTIGCCEVDGGGGDEVFGGGVFGGSVVFSGDGVGNEVRGVVCVLLYGLVVVVVCGWCLFEREVGALVKAPISMMILRVPKKDKWCGTRRQVFALVKGVRVTRHPTCEKVVCRGWVVILSAQPERYVIVDRGGGEDIK
ncbi:hypothetical protein Tco_0986139 [Tanacetum coccineum]